MQYILSLHRRADAHRPCTLKVAVAVYVIDSDHWGSVGTEGPNRSTRDTTDPGVRNDVIGFFPRQPTEVWTLPSLSRIVFLVLQEADQCQAASLGAT